MSDLYQIPKADARKVNQELVEYCLDFLTNTYLNEGYYQKFDIGKKNNLEKALGTSLESYRKKSIERLKSEADEYWNSPDQPKTNLIELQEIILARLKHMFYVSNYEGILKLLEFADNHHKHGYLDWNFFQHKYKDTERKVKIYKLKIEKSNSKQAHTEPNFKNREEWNKYFKEIFLKEAFPEELEINPETAWTIVSKNRKRVYRSFTKIAAFDSKSLHENGAVFSYSLLRRHYKLLHQIDINTNSHLNSDYNFEFLLDEAIASSKHEGAHTTRRRAKEIIETGQEPKDNHERMIVNNYRVIDKIQSDYKNSALSEELLLNMHYEITKGTLENSLDAGVLRNDFLKEPLHIASRESQGRGDNRKDYIAPNMTFVKLELCELIEFANNEELDNNFIHPVIKAILLHFWIAYLHPFEDGNGRTARALFYWYLFRKGYSEFKLIPISCFIAKSPKQYSDAFINSEQDNYDLTYFIDYNLRKINEAQNYYKKRLLERDAIKKADKENLRPKENSFNSRQIECLRYLYKNPSEFTNVKSYSLNHAITKATAVKDLKGLMEEGYLNNYKKGRNVFYKGTEKLKSFFTN